MPSNPSPQHDSSIATPNLDIIRDFSRILSHSLDLSSLARHFTLKVSEIVGISRVALFLEHPELSLASASRRSSYRLNCICSIGIPSDVQGCLELASHSGLGSWVIQSGQILRLEQAAAMLSPTEYTRVQHEFDLLDCEIAVPIHDRERTIGVAMLGGHPTGEAFSDQQLRLIFHLFEELGVSIKNNWLRKALSANQKLMSEVLASLKSGTAVIGPQLEILHTNPALRAVFLGDNPAPPGLLSFSELPTSIAKRIHQVVENGHTIDPFLFRTEDDDAKSFRVSIVPLQNPSQRLPQSTIVMMEDVSEVEQARENASEAAHAQLTSKIAKRFAHEVRNSIGPLTTHLQLIDDRYYESSFKESLKQALGTETARISRFAGQMLFLAETRPAPSVLTGIEKLLREAFAKAEAAIRISGILTIQNNDDISCIRCYPEGLGHAFQEVFTNGLQTNPASPQVIVNVQKRVDDEQHLVCVSFRDNGEGFDPDSAKHACEPFFTSRTTGLGLGLTVAQRAVHEHGGWLEISSRSDPSTPDVSMFFPTTDHHE